MAVKFSKTKLIKKYFGDVIREYGFEYAGASAWTWDFHRQKGTARQEIIIMRHRYFPDQVKLLFHANGYEWSDQEPRDFAEPYKYKEFWKFESEEEYIAILQEFVEIVKKYGLDMLERISEPKDPIYPTPEMNRYLFENYDSMVEDTCRKYHFDKSGAEGIKEITQLLYENRDKDFEDAKKFLLEMTMLYVRLLKNDIIGSLTFENNICYFGNDNVIRQETSPLDDVLVLWRIFHRGESMGRNNLMMIIYKQIRETQGINAR